LLGVQSTPTAAMCERKDKPPAPSMRFVFASSYIVAGRLGRPIERPSFFATFAAAFVNFVFFVVKTRETPFVFVSSFLL